ncbi:Bax inhibitor-1/YccA family protein [Enterococcus sp. LJL128]|uniref:Bax inhibitor-1/YccA family protein n=1 Tax=Enterococcus sp. LJL51 TaxID=3416656 RepID=UPI003CF94403
MNQMETANVQEGLNKFYAKIYGFLGLGIAVSAFISYLVLDVYFWEVIVFLSQYNYALMGLWIAEIALVIFLGVRAAKNPSLAIGGFILYSVLNGITLAITLAAYTEATVVSAFISAASTFGCMALVGVLTKKDLSGMGRAMYTALFGIIIALLLNTFLFHSGTMEYIISIIMVLVFSGLTAYDNQRIRNVYFQSNGTAGNGIAVYLALQLYLDFINLFLAFLRIFSKK